MHGFARYTGSEEAIAGLLLGGFDAGVPGLSMIFPQLHVALAKDARAGNWDRAVATQRAIVPLLDLYAAPLGGASPTTRFFAAVKEALRQQGISPAEQDLRPVPPAGRGRRGVRSRVPCQGGRPQAVTVWSQLDADIGHAVDIATVRGSEDGPRLAVIAGVHGDEPEGVLAARRLLARLQATTFAGTVVVVPVSCPGAFSAGENAGVSAGIDGLDMARTFPGTPDGSDTERVANALTEQVIAPASLLVDLHCVRQGLRDAALRGRVPARRRNG